MSAPKPQQDMKLSPHAAFIAGVEASEREHPVTPTPEPPHTSTPWKVEAFQKMGSGKGEPTALDFIVTSDTGSHITDFCTEANARHIVRAVNSYDALREALKMGIERLESAEISGRTHRAHGYPGCAVCDDITTMRAALRLAEEGQ